MAALDMWTAPNYYAKQQQGYQNQVIVNAQQIGLLGNANTSAYNMDWTASTAGISGYYVQPQVTCYQGQPVYYLEEPKKPKKQFNLLGDVANELAASVEAMCAEGRKYLH